MVDIVTTITNTLNNLVATGMNSVVQAAWMALVLVVSLILGYLVAQVIKMLVVKVFETIQLEERIKARGLHEALYGLSVTRIYSVLLFWWTFLVILGQGFVYATLPQLGTAVFSLTAYFYSLAQGITVLVGFLFLGKWLTNQIKTKSANVFTQQGAFLLQVFIAYIGVIIAVPLIFPSTNLQILSDLLSLLIATFVVALGLGFGLATGLGLKEAVSKSAIKNQSLFDNLFEKVKRK